MLKLIEISYVLSAVLFIIGLKMMNKIPTAHRGNQISAFGMLLAIATTVASKEFFLHPIILISIATGAFFGVLSTYKVKFTSIPELLSLIMGAGSITAFIVSLKHSPPNVFSSITLLVSSMTAVGSVISHFKLRELFKLERFLGIGTVGFTLIIFIIHLFLMFYPNVPFYYQAITALIFGISIVLPIKTADIPVALSLFNCLAGLSCCTAGFMLANNLLIVAGSFVTATGLVLTHIICKAMNRSLQQVLFGSFSLKKQVSASSSETLGEVQPISCEDAYVMLEAAKNIVIVPGYGLAVAQAQHLVKELAEQLETNGADVKFAIHPVAGRMPGHLNVLLAEANIPYEKLVVPEDVNPIMENVDVALVIGADDIVNPKARYDKTSSLYGMPVIDVDKAKTCIVLKRSLKTGYAGVGNPLFYQPKTRLLFGDAKQSLSSLVSELKQV